MWCAKECGICAQERKTLPTRPQIENWGPELSRGLSGYATAPSSLATSNTLVRRAPEPLTLLSSNKKERNSNARSYMSQQEH